MDSHLELREKLLSTQTEFSYVYAHIPFCDVICHYCDFYTEKTRLADFNNFFQALENEFNFYSDFISPKKLTSIYLGGGTPGASPLEKLDLFFRFLKQYIDSISEICIEANPKDFKERNTLENWISLGINRISMGVQSFDDSILKTLGRNHRSIDAKEAILQLKNKVENFSIDLIYGVPGQTLHSFEKDLQFLLENNVPHISCYNLSLTKEHFLYKALPSDQTSLSFIQLANTLLESHGYTQYEISNFGKGQLVSKNNWNYWSGGSYLALGPSASGFNGKNIRWKNISNWKQYTNFWTDQRNQDQVLEWEELSLKQRRIEVLYTKLRLKEGLDLEWFSSLFLEDLEHSHEKVFDRWQKEGLAQREKTKIFLTFKGRMLCDQLVQELI
ncbi:MAG: radical SAM family heme chaperone HemW [Oligoflexia bacterium]|nr:radical SAM family heme chaperone HemW [Oligoflexia bacterium]